MAVGAPPPSTNCGRDPVCGLDFPGPPRLQSPVVQELVWIPLCRDAFRVGPGSARLEVTGLGSQTLLRVGAQQRPLASPRQVQRLDRHTRSRGDAAHGRSDIATFDEFGAGGGQEPPAGVRTSSGAGLTLTRSVARSRRR